jgi:hypothetical protein
MYPPKVTVVKKGCMWHVRYYVDLRGQEKRQRKSVPIGPCTGKDKLTKPEAVRKGAEVIASLGVNTADHLERAMNVSPIVTFRQRVEWCRKYHKAWTDGKPGPIQTMESQLTKHILPRFGSLPLFEARNGSPISGNNVLKRVLHPLLKRLGIPRAGLHAFRHSRVTMLRKRGTPEDLQKQWIGHSSLRTTDRYSHTNQELEYRRLAASKAGLSFTVGPNGPNSAIGKSAATV